MTIDDIHRLVDRGESRHLELKKTTGELKDGMHSACAFLNTDGGWLIFGVTPNSKRILGQEVTDATQREIAHALSGIEPAVYIPVEYIDVPDHPGNKVIALRFDGWVRGQQPFTYHGAPYLKMESTTVPMPRDMFEERIRAYKPQQYSWEKIMSDTLTVADLDENRIRGLVRLGVNGGRIPESAMYEPVETLLRKSEMLLNGRPNNAAVALFTTKLSDYPQMHLQMARFYGTTKSEFIDNQVVDGNFFDLLDAGMSFCFKHLNLSGVINGLYREEKLEIPYKALREALINALCHRQYERYNLTPSIAIYDDRVEIANPGHFPPEITPEILKGPHDSYPYNPVMASFLYRTTILEKWGSGSLRIIEACEQQGVTPPTWSLRGAFIVVNFPRPHQYPTSTQLVNSLADSQLSNKSQTTDTVTPTVTSTVTSTATDKVTDKVTDKATDKVTDKVTDKALSSFDKTREFSNSKTNNTGRKTSLSTTDPVRHLLAIIGSEELSRAEMMKALGLKHTIHFFQAYLNPALEAGLIEPLYPDQPRHPRQKYRRKKS